MIDNLLNKLCVFIEEKSCPISVTELIAFSITRPFNMKGQEFENKISYMLQSAIKECEEIKNDFSECFVTTYNNKSAKDLMISYKYQEDELTNLVEKIEEDFAITLDKKDLLHSLNVFCYEQNFLSQKKTKFYLSQTVGSNDYKKTLLRKLTP